MEGKSYEDAETPKSLHSPLNTNILVPCLLYSPALQSLCIPPLVFSCCTVKDALCFCLSIYMTFTHSSSAPLSVFLCVSRILQCDGRKQGHREQERKEGRMEGGGSKESLLFSSSNNFFCLCVTEISLISKRKKKKYKLRPQKPQMK